MATDGTCFWHKPLDEMTEQEWESLCDGCGKCCLNKLIDDDTDEVFFTNVACQLLNHKSCQCNQYPKRFKYVPDCLKVSVQNLEELYWFPPSCAYRRLHEGRGLPSWHPLLTGSHSAMHAAGMSIRNKVLDERDVGTEGHILAGCIVHWPAEDID
ncbi:MAG: YcgN family cysteine cluster protein [Ferrimonas sp.]